MKRPEDLFDREREWKALTTFVSSRADGLSIGVVSGRRRQGKSFLLRRITRAVHGLYHQAQELERTQALDRFADDIARGMGLPAGHLRFPDWEAALRTALGYPQRGSATLPSSVPAGARRVLVLDELPYLLNHSPEIPSVLQELYDESRDLALPHAKVIVCGSSLSVMTDLLSGTKPLRGRAGLDLIITPFDYRTAARYWGLDADPMLAFMTDTVVGGTAGYRPLVDGPPASVAGFGRWLSRNILNPSHALYQEKNYLLREDVRIADKQLYNSVLAAVASGNHSPSAIATSVGRDTNSLRHPLRVLTDAGFLLRVDDVLSARRPLYRLADPIVRFSEVVIEPYRPQLDEGEAEEVWGAAEAAVRARVNGPHFEQMARSWTAMYAGDRFGTALGEVGPAVVNDPAGKSQHEIDVVAVPRGTTARGDAAAVALLGEAKATSGLCTPGDLARLERVRDVLVERGRDARGAHLALFSLKGFDKRLTDIAVARHDVHLVSLADLYA